MQKSFQLYQMYVITAFLNGVLEEEVFTRQPEGAKLVKAENGEEPVDQSVYQSAVGSLLYLSSYWNKTRCEL